MDDSLRLAITSVLGLISGLCGGWLRSYFSEKGKNLATKEDIEEITRKIESVKTEHAHQLEKLKAKYVREIEGLRSQLTHRTHISRVQFDVEYRIYQEIWIKLVDLRNATLVLRPTHMFDRQDPNDSEEEHKRKRYDEWAKTFNEFLKQMEYERPFYAEEVYEVLDKIRSISRRESILSYRILPQQRDNKYWEDASAKAEELLKLIDDTREEIRKRIQGIQVVNDLTADTIANVPSQTPSDEA